MSLRILHILSSNFIAGSTIYAIELSEKQASGGNEVYLITDMLVKSDMFSSVQLPVSNRSFAQRFRNIRFLKKFIHDNQIDIVHAHSRAASWIAYYALRGTKVALVSTIHGRQVKHSSLKKLDVYGDRIIGICPNLIFHLKDEMQFEPNKLVFIPNGFDMEVFQKVTRSRDDGKIVISFIGRFNGPKGENIARFVIDVFPKLLQDYPSLCIQLTGGEWDSFPVEGKKAFEELKAKYGKRINNFGFSNKVHQMIVDSDLVIGAGRIAIQGLLNRVPVLAIGEACCHGIVTEANINDAISSNFGDILAVKSSFQLNINEILRELRCFIDNKQAYKIDLLSFMEMYDHKDVFPKIMNVYTSALMRKAYRGNIPVLMYHKIPDAPIESQHQIFVTKRKFEKHLQFFKLRGLTSLTFKDYLEFLKGEKPINEFPKRPFIITFDDGYENNYKNMLPLAQKYGFKGVLFLLGDFSIKNNNWDIGENPEVNQLMSIDQKRAFVDSGWEIGAHTVSHCDLTNLSNDKAMDEILTSKEILEEKLDTKIISFAYPYGNYNEPLKTMVKKSGFEFGISTDSGGLFIEDDPFAIFRVNMFPNENILQLYKKTSSWYRRYYHRKRGK
jgi:peptidoglycan/xylan/chitin deacetylase (PgdA/CDA1 family)/glycosyltransferase involved in cell wall biosynthesis